MVHLVGSVVFMTSLVGGVTYLPKVVPANVQISGGFSASGKLNILVPVDANPSSGSGLVNNPRTRKAAMKKANVKNAKGDRSMKTIGSKRFGWSTSHLGVVAPSTEG